MRFKIPYELLWQRDKALYITLFGAVIFPIISAILYANIGTGLVALWTYTIVAAWTWWILLHRIKFNEMIGLVVLSSIVFFVLILIYGFVTGIS
jgi:hypothetical protein